MLYSPIMRGLALLGILPIFLQLAFPMPDAAAGRKLFAAHCAACHGQQGQGGRGARRRHDYLRRALLEPEADIPESFGDYRWYTVIPDNRVDPGVAAGTGRAAWEFKLHSPPWSGLLSTAGGLVFGGSSEGYFFALDASSGKPLWKFPTGGAIFANPIGFLSDGRQHVAIAAGHALFVFAVE